MTKKTFMLLPIMLLLTACNGNKNIQIEENNKIKDTSSLNASNVSYNDYRSSYESENNKLKNRPHLKYEPKISKTNYDKLVLTNDENTKNDTLSPKHLTKKQAFLDFYNDWKNVKYKMGGTSRKGIDCSAFTQKAFKEKFGIELPRTTTTQVKVGVEVKKSELKMGDLVFFKTSKVNNHVGIYMGNGSFLHSSIKGIKFTKLDKPFYKHAYWTARRIIN